MWILFRLRRDSFIGQRIFAKARQAGTIRGSALHGITEEDFTAAGVVRVPRIEGVDNGLPALADGQIVDVTNVIWATGYKADFSWIDKLAVDELGHPYHKRGIVDGEPGLYFLGLTFQHRLTSDRLVGVGEDAKYLTSIINFY